MKNLIIGFVALFSISALADCSLGMSGGFYAKHRLQDLASLRGPTTFLTTNISLQKDGETLISESVTVRIKSNEKSASQKEKDRTLDQWIAGKTRLREVAIQARCQPEIFLEIGLATYAVGLI